MKCSKQIGLLIMTIVAVVRSIPSEMDSRYTPRKHDFSSSKTPLAIDYSSENSTNILSRSERISNPISVPILTKHDNKIARKMTRIRQSGSNIKANHNNSFMLTNGKSAKRHETTKILPVLNSIKVSIPTTKKFVKVKTKVIKATTPKSNDKYTYKKNPTPVTPYSIKTKKTTLHNIKTNLSDSATELKQNWYEEGVPYPNPNPEISSSSPTFSLGDISSISPIISDDIGVSDLNPIPEISSHSPPYSISDVPSILGADAPEISSFPSVQSAVESDTLSAFNLDMVPDATKISNGGSIPCPTVHISSAVMNSQQKQGCSDLNLVINSHIHQNPSGGGTRFPAVNTYDSLPADSAGGLLSEAVEEDEILADSAAADPAILADPAVAADPGAGIVQSAAPAAPAVPASPAAGGTGGTGGNGGNGDGGSWKFPDLRHLFEALGYLWNGMGYFLSFLRNPYLYIIPMALFFLLGFFKVLALFPWWIPLLLLYLGIKNNDKPKQSISFYQHIHKPVHHLDGWFWNKNTKTWQNVQDFADRKKDVLSSIDYDISDSLSTDLGRIHGIYSNKELAVSKTKKRIRR